MPLPKKDSGDQRPGANPGRTQNGTRSNFRTDTAISNSRAVNERVLKPWMPDGPVGGGESLEHSGSGRPWDQFAANEERFGVKTDYDESIYTTTIDKSHPEYRERAAAADKIAREIERSAPTTSHVAEERIMDFVGSRDKGGDEEEKYSGVRRQDFPPLGAGGRDTKYTPPAKRANAGQPPVDPAIISSQLKGASSRKSPAGRPEESKAPASSSKSNTPKPDAGAKASETKVEPKAGADKTTDGKAQDAKEVNSAATKEAKVGDKATATPLRSAAAGRAQGGEGAPSATSTVERDVLNSFKNFAALQRSNAEKARIGKAKMDKEVKLTELKKFADTFKLSTPVPSDLIGIIAKDPARQKEIQAKAMQNAEEMMKAKEASAKVKESPSKESQTKTQPSETTSTPASTETKPAAARPQASHAVTHSTLPTRHSGVRQSYGPSYNAQPFRNDRGGHGQQPRTTGQLGQRLREQHKPATVPHAPMATEPRLPPTGPANNLDSAYNRRLSGVPGHMNKLNPNTQEFRPNPFASTFNPSSHPSAASSPRSAVNHTADTSSQSNVGAVAAVHIVQTLRRKSNGISKDKFSTMAHIKTIKPPQAKNWDDNGGLRPTYDTQPTWRQLNEETEKPDSTMHLTYKQFFERNPFGGPPGSLSTPHTAHVVPQMAHQHQLPFHLQQGAHAMAPRQSPHMAPMQMQTQHQAPSPHVGYATDDHRMMHSNSAQSFTSPRMGQAPVAYPAGLNSPAQVSYSQPMMQPYMGTAAPPMGPLRSFSSNAQYMGQQQQQPGQMGGPMMMQPQFMAGPQGMMASHPQFANYPMSQGQFIPPGMTVPPQPMPGQNGYPSPGRPAAPMMAHQGSQQGQSVFGMSPNMQYQQPVFVPQQPGQMTNSRGYANPAGQHYGSSPQQQMHQYGPQHRSGSNTYGNKNFSPHGQHQGPQANPNMASGPGQQGRPNDVGEEAK